MKADKLVDFIQGKWALPLIASMLSVGLLLIKDPKLQKFIALCLIFGGVLFFVLWFIAWGLGYGY